uniref:vomeronasal type-2 receptor 26-like n=1 Tax=Podarcis muralis TaxID=64176 RepID=UPI0010A06E2F|nr:vomeronasal type-2 receptor 26-like [Podarcis muralis]
MHSLPDQIIMECNEGSANMFYYVLGYMGLLALVSFIVAFFARKLPDVFNEAKFITFSIYTDSRRTYRTTLDLLFKSHQFVPNYKCGTQENVIGVIGGLSSDTSSCMADILGLFKIPQISYGSFEPAVKNQGKFPSFCRMVPSEALQYRGIIQLLLHFKWKWVGLYAIDNEGGDRFLQAMEEMLLQNGMCSAFTERAQTHLLFSDSIQEMLHHKQNTLPVFMRSNANVVVIYGESGSITWLGAVIGVIKISQILIPRNKRLSTAKVWITTAQIDFTLYPIQAITDLDRHMFHGAISFTIHSKEIEDFQKFLQLVNPSWANEDGFINVFWEQAFSCSLSNSFIYGRCTGEEMLESLPAPYFEMSMTGHSYSIYNAAYALAHALHNLQSAGLKRSAREFSKRMVPQNVEPWQLHSILHKISFNNTAGDAIALDEHGELAAGFDITNLVTFPNKSYVRVQVGRLDPPGKALTIYEDRIEWHRGLTQVPPLSVCNDICRPGYGKKKKEGKTFCCYACAPCPAGMISNVKAVVLGIFINHRDTAIVKANNRSLTYILLISLLFCFLCSLMFIGKPNEVTCLLRQTAFGIIFCVSISSILAKTASVLLAFMATKPGSRMRKWVGKRSAYSIILSCSHIQVGICALWLAMFPPFPDRDTHAMMDQIVLLCNEGSVTMFYCVLGFMGFLAIVCFTVAFVARKLPDSFNEAKFITFSMLVFCSVWLTFIPTYLSTRGKDMVAVEIFSILASSAGLLGCIFAPKCYIIVLRPELNKKEHLIVKKK